MKDYYAEGDVALYLGDAIGVLGALPEESVDLIFSNPPYNLSNGGHTCYASMRASVNKGHWDRSWGIEADFCLKQGWLATYHTHLKPSKEKRVGAGRKMFRCQWRDYPLRTPIEEPCGIVQCNWNRTHDGTDIAGFGFCPQAQGDTHSSENRGPALTASPTTSTPRNVAETPQSIQYEC